MKVVHDSSERRSVGGKIGQSAMNHSLLNGHSNLMPYGGLKDSGFGKEGPKYAVQEMSELKMVVFHLKS